MDKIDFGDLEDLLSKDFDAPAWLGPAAEHAVGLAEHVSWNGRVKKRYAKKLLREALRSHDIGPVPDWIETPLEDLIAGLVIELAWSVKIGPKKRKFRPRGA